MAFIRTTGVNPLREALRRHCDRNQLRVLITTYTGSTEQRTLELLLKLGAKVRYHNTKRPGYTPRPGFSIEIRLLQRHTSGRPTSHTRRRFQGWSLERARLGGSQSGCRRQGERRLFHILGECRFPPLRFKGVREARATVQGPRPEGLFLAPVEMRPWPFQERLLEKVAVARQRGHHRNLIAAATGTGETVMAALDYARLRRVDRDRLLFVAHRKEILDQSQATFRHALRDLGFGEQWVAGQRPQRFEHVFASIQSLRRADLENLKADHFDVVVVDEFHHAAAPSYKYLLEHVQPRELLGLTATRAFGWPPRTALVR